MLQEHVEANSDSCDTGQREEYIGSFLKRVHVPSLGLR